VAFTDGRDRARIDGSATQLGGTTDGQEGKDPEEAEADKDKGQRQGEIGRLPPDRTWRIDVSKKRSTG
jgi:hypothetical protein